MAHTEHFELTTTGQRSGMHGVTYTIMMGGEKVVGGIATEAKALALAESYEAKHESIAARLERDRAARTVQAVATQIVTAEAQKVEAQTQAPAHQDSPTAQPLATDRQVAYAMKLIVPAFRAGAMHLPSHAELTAMPRGQISTLIDTLREQY